MALKKDTKSGKWKASFGSTHHGTRERKTFDSKKEAEHWLAQKTTENHSGKAGHGYMFDAKSPIDEFSQFYIGNMKDCTNHHKRDVGHTVRKIKTTLKIKTLGDINIQALERYKSIPKSARTINKHISEFKTMLNFLERGGYIDRNPIRLLKPLREPPQSRRALSEIECNEILRSAKIKSPDKFYPIILTLISLGLRKKELVTLEWTDIDFSRGTVRIIDKPHLIVAGEPCKCKWGSSRVLPLRESLAKVFLSMERTSNFIFPTKNGNFRYENFVRDFRRAISLAKVYNLEEITPHYLRHTFISQLLAYGKQDIKTVSYLAGHKNLKTTQGYVHLLGGTQELMDAVQSLPDYSV